MGVTYQAVDWNDFKKRYDSFLALGILLYLSAFCGTCLFFFPKMTHEILLIRAFGSAALILLHLVLVIGPLARLDPRWLPLLYNRRHLGVVTFLLAFIHASLALLTYHAGTDQNLLSAFLASAGQAQMGGVHFQILGLGAFLILFLMASTSHDFWLVNLTPPIWKSLHMGVYVAYALLLAHVLFGVLQAELNPLYFILLGLGASLVGGLHLWAGWKGKSLDRELAEMQPGWVRVCRASELEEDVPRGVTVKGERVAILLYEKDRISAVSGVCQHQNGPLAEGRYVKGCLTCPWHGYQYDPATGRSPEPYSEKLPTFEVDLRDGWLWLKKDPHPPGTPLEPARLQEESGA